ncbi:MAG: histidine triad nucleotide-binding protein [Eubacteriaceae bacterium]|jgi:histidine triad (HIT) family protein|nr:histidine triad nucleotide-binding protein [Eubacteriaceae bacterium]
MQDDCLFCKIANKTIPSDIVFEDEKVIAFKDINPQAPVHILIIPSVHYDSVLNIAAGNDILSHIHTVAIRLAIKFDIAQKGFRLVNNCGTDGGQTVGHLHYHLLGGRALSWPPG